MMTRTEATQLVIRLGSVFPSTVLTELGIATYADNILDLEIEHGRVALAHLMRTVKFFPSIAEFRAAAVAVANPNRLNPEEAWEEVMHQLKTAGYYREPKWSSELVARAVRALGDFKALAIMQWEALAFERNRFLGIYKSFLERAVDDQRTGRVALPSPAEAKKLLEEIYSALPPKDAGP